jgi:hypothetical protein
VGGGVVTRRREETYIQAAFEEHARTLGWLVYHTHDPRRSEPGWPDAFCVRGGRAVAVELKTANGRTSKAQERWIRELDMVPGVSAFVARCPRDWPRITEALR